MSCDLNSDSFHVKKGGVRKTARPAYATKNKAYYLSLIMELEKRITGHDAIFTDELFIPANYRVAWSLCLKQMHAYIKSGGKAGKLTEAVWKSFYRK